MEKFEIIPVLDLLNNGVVHAVKGERASYKPLKSYLFKNNNPEVIIDVLHQNYNFNVFYIADLDSIMKNEPNYKILSKLLMKNNCKFLIDLGIKNFEDVLDFCSFGVRNIILGLETLKDKKVIEKTIEKNFFENVYVSVDMYAERLISEIPAYQNKSILRVIKDLSNLGVKKIILLDLKKVGSKKGGIPDLYKKIRSTFIGKILVGGGIRDASNIINYHKSGFSGVLIGTALYDGTIKAKELHSLVNKNHTGA